MLTTWPVTVAAMCAMPALTCNLAQTTSSLDGCVNKTAPFYVLKSQILAVLSSEADSKHSGKLVVSSTC